MIRCIRSSVGRPPRRPGTVLPMLALTIVALVGFLALAIDVGMLAIAKAQAQNAADLAALTASRSLNGDSSTTSPNSGAYNNGGATTNAQNILSWNVILGQTIQSSQLSLSYGSYDYDQTAQTFTTNFPPTSGKPYSAAAATITANNLPGAFSSVFGLQVLPSVTATAQAVHRPRDIAMALDLSGSMRFGTCLGYDFYTSSRTTNNPDTAYPKFGPYSSGSAGMVLSPSSDRTSTYDNYTIAASNTTATTTSYSKTYMNNFYQNAAYATTLVRAFDAYTSSDGGNTWSAPTGTPSPSLPTGTTYTTTPGGDRFLWKNGSTTTYAQNVKDVVGSTTRNAWWELDGYSGDTSGSFNNSDLGSSTYTSGSFNAYTQGPGYYGKTFMIWPPDPRRPLNTATATSYSTTAADKATINQFLQDFGYTSDLTNTGYTTTLSAKISSTTATTITVNSATKFPTSGLSQTPSVTFRIMVDSEIMIVTAASGTSWTVQRGQDGTTKATHSSGATVALVTAPALYGIYTAANTSVAPGGKTPSSSQTWPWPNDGGTASGTTLSNYLTTQVYIPSSLGQNARLLTINDAAYQKIMRLYNWNYVVDNYNPSGSGSSYPGLTPCDWRIRFFGTDDNTVLFNTSTGSLNTPSSSTYTINYTEILRWIASSKDPFPTQLRAGRVKYYSSIPTAITGSWPSYGNTDQRFWKEYIDYCLGFRQTSSTAYTDISAMAGYGSDFTWGAASLTSAPSSTQYMTYTDIPARPRLRGWFGPLTMVDYLNNYNLYENPGSAAYWFMQPGDSYEAPVYTGKLSYLAAIDTMQSNHPNDWFSLIAYSWPRGASNGTVYSGIGFGRFNCVRCPMGTNYSYASASLLFPFSTINADGTCNNTEVTPYDADTKNSNTIPSANFVDTPRADGNTCFAMSLMLAYNQFATTPTSDTTLRTFTTSTPIAFPTGMAGGLGRKGAQKVVIFETDGLANTTATASLVTNGSYKYYQIRYDMNAPSGSEYPTVGVYTINNTTVLNQIYSLVQQLSSDYSTSRNPFRLYAIGFGPVFTGADATSAKTTLQTMQFYGGTQSSIGASLPTNQIITGTDSQMLTNLTSAFTSILQNGVQIALIK